MKNSSICLLILLFGLGCIHNSSFACHYSMPEKLVITGAVAYTASTWAGIVGFILKAKNNSLFREHFALTNFLRSSGSWLSRAALLPTVIGTAICLKQSFQDGISDNSKMNLRLLGGIGFACSTIMLGEHLGDEIVHDESDKRTGLQNFIRMFWRNKEAYTGGGALLGSVPYLATNYHRIRTPKILSGLMSFGKSLADILIGYNGPIKKYLYTEQRLYLQH